MKQINVDEIRRVRDYIARVIEVGGTPTPWPARYKTVGCFVCGERTCGSSPAFGCGYDKAGREIYAIVRH